MKTTRCAEENPAMATDLLVAAATAVYFVALVVL